MTKSLARLLAPVALSAVFLMSSLAAPPAARADDLGGSTMLASLQNASWAQPLRDEEMSELRGGFFGQVYFNVFGVASITNLGGETAAQGTTTIPTIGTNGNFVEVSTILGDIPGLTNGSGGILQVANVTGNMNVVENQLFMQIAIINGPEIPNMAALFNPGQ